MLLAQVSVVQALATVASIYVVGWIVYCRYFHPLRSIPGPFLASISRAWIVLKTAAGDMEHTQRALHKKHGHLVRIGPNEVSCSDPEALKIIYNTKNIFLKSDFYRPWAALATTGNNYVGHFPVSDEKQHAERRRIVNRVYSMASVLESEKSIDECTQLFCTTMREFARDHTVVDLSLWTSLYAYDVVGELFYGKMFGYMRERGDFDGVMAAVDSILPGMAIASTVPSYMSKPYLFASVMLSSSVRGALDAIGRLDVASRAAVKRRREEIEANADDKRDLLRKMFAIRDEAGEKLDFHLEDIMLESHTAIFAGSDTTSTAMNSILYHLMRKPAVYAKLTAEIDAAAADGTLSTPVSYAEATKLPYLKACINEGMRLHPSVALNVSRFVPPGGASISGHFFPEGYTVGVNAAVVQYDRNVFGPDADDFNPERWIEGDAVAMERTMFQFGGGSRICIGKNVSLSEIYKLVPQILRDFHIRLADPCAEWKTHNFWFNKQSDIFMTVEERVH